MITTLMTDFAHIQYEPNFDNKNAKIRHYYLCAVTQQKLKQILRDNKSE